MRLWYYNTTNPKTMVFEIDGSLATIGRSSKNDVVIESSFVADEAVSLNLRDGSWYLNCIGGAECVVDDRVVSSGERRRLHEESEFSIFPFNFSFRPIDSEENDEGLSQSQRESYVNGIVNELHRIYVEQDADKIENRAKGVIDEMSVLEVEDDIKSLMEQQNLYAKTDVVAFLAGQFIRTKLLEAVFSDAQTNCLWDRGQRAAWARSSSAIPHYERDANRMIAQLAKKLCLFEQSDLSYRANIIEGKFWSTWEKFAPSLLTQLLQYLAVQEVQKQLKDIVFGYGPLEDLLRTPTIDEIMVVGREKIYVEKNGTIESSGRQFINDKILYSVIERIASRVGRPINTSQPLVDARLLDGSRVNIVIPPLALDGPTITIRKFRKQKLTAAELVEKESITSEAVEFLEAIVGRRCNILVAGGTGTGKTTLLNCVSQFVSEKERIVTIEDTAELQLSNAHVCRMETKVANSENAGSYEIRDLLVNSLRMRPDRIIVGECRGPEALDMLQAMNTGHDGSMTTLHANSPQDVVLRLEVLVQSGADLPVSSIRQQIASAIDFVVQLEKIPVKELVDPIELSHRTDKHEKRRVVSYISEVVGVDKKTGDVLLKDIFALEKQGPVTVLAPTGSLPSMMDDLIEGGLQMEKLFPETQSKPVSCGEPVLSSHPSRPGTMSNRTELQNA